MLSCALLLRCSESGHSTARPPSVSALNLRAFPRRAWLVYAVGVTAYVVAVTHRTTIGVAGVAAVARFHTDAATLSTLAVMQLLVYAAMQVPVGVLIDRFGPRVLVLSGSALMLVGQVLVGFAPDIGTAVLGRILVGGGDAAIFTSVVRLISSWFSGPVVPQLYQWLGSFGQLGQVLSAVPFAWLLGESGWTTAFLSAAACSVVALVAGVLVLADRPPGQERAKPPASMAESMALLRDAYARPGTRLGFWTAFVTQSSGIVFTLMWGYPFMVSALGYPPATAAHLLLVVVVAGAFAGPFLGVLAGRFPLRRSNLVLGVVALVLGAWIPVLAWPGTPPFWTVLVLLVALGIGIPSGIIGFDYARSFNPDASLGSANGIVNAGGFVASVLMMYGIGWALDLRQTVLGTSGTADLYSLAAFRLAFLVQFPVLIAGTAWFLRARRRTRRRMAEETGVVVGPLRHAIAVWWRQR